MTLDISTTTAVPPSLHDGIRSFTYRELTERNWPAQEHLIKPWLMTGESAMLWAATGVGKTMLSLTLAALVAGGGSIAGWQSEGRRKVLIIDGEMRGEDIVQRLDLLAGSIEGIDREAALDNIEVRARQLQGPETDFYDIGDKETQQELSEHIVRNGIDLVILDNVTTLTETMGDENSVEAVKPVLRFLMDLKRTGVAVILVHHANKGGSSYRGSTAIATTFEVIIGLTKPEGTPMGSTSFKLTFDKFRAKADQALVPRVFSLLEAGWHAEEDEGDEAVRLTKAIRSGRYMTQQDAGFSLGFDKVKTSRLMQRAIAEGRMKQGEAKAIFRAVKDEALDSPDDLL